MDDVWCWDCKYYSGGDCCLGENPEENIGGCPYMEEREEV